MLKMNLQRYAGLGTVTNAKRMNLSRIVYAPLTKDDDTNCTYSDVKTFGGPQEIQIAPKVAAGDCYEGGVLTENISKVTGYDITVAVSKLQIGVHAEIMGHKFTTKGEMIDSKKDQPIYFALGYEIEQTSNKRELVWLLKCIAQPFSTSTKQSEGNISFGQDSIKITTVNREFDGNFRLIGDTNNSTFTDTMAETFLDEVPTTITPETTT